MRRLPPSVGANANAIGVATFGEDFAAGNQDEVTGAGGDKVDLGAGNVGGRDFGVGVDLFDGDNNDVGFGGVGLVQEGPLRHQRIEVEIGWWRRFPSGRYFGRCPSLR